jgi:dipeptidyl aminopeptidase/acylaminoacyl peptidase
MPRRLLLTWFGIQLLLPATTWSAESLVIPSGVPATQRDIEIEDLLTLRDIDSFSVSPDGSHFAILVRQADAAANTYRVAWFVGSRDGGALIPVGEGGEARFLTQASGAIVGEFGGSVARWSPDERWIAYLVQRDGEVQLWRSRTDGSFQEQVSHSAADLRDFAWSADGRSLYYTAGSPRAALRARDEEGRRSGFGIDEYAFYTEVIYPGKPIRPRESQLALWSVTADGAQERLATESEKAVFAELQREYYKRMFATGTELQDAPGLASSAMPPIRRSDGATAWFERSGAADRGLFPCVRVMASIPRSAGRKFRTVSCEAPECSGHFLLKAWWSGKDLVFWRWEGSNLRESGIYQWSPVSGRLRRILKAPEDRLSDCDLAGETLFCLRETQARPRHVVSIDVSDGRVKVLADVNPELAGIRTGTVERIEWDLAPDVYRLGFPKRMRGYILYPPRFDPKQRYPVFIAPYTAGGFPRGDVGDEHPLLVYAASGIVVINSEFPFEDAAAEALPDLTRRTYSPELGFPHLTMMADSTFRALDVARAKGWVDESRVGIGGVSHGSFVPLWMVQQQDRLAALSLGSPGWSTMEPYIATRTGMQQGADVWPESSDFWSQIDIADHTDAIEAPLLFQLADREAVFGAPRMFRRLSDARIPYDAYIFPQEYHEKWQPAHRQAVYTRNLDWFRFWLQDHEDPAKEKVPQYERWRQLRDLQCKNPRALRRVCATNVTSAMPPQ